MSKSSIDASEDQWRLWHQPSIFWLCGKDRCARAPMATCMHQILAVVIAAYIANSHQFFSCCNYILWNTCVKFQILSKSFTTSVLTFLCSSEKNGFVRFNIQCVEKISCWYEVVETNFWTPPHHMLVLPAIHIWKHSSLTNWGGISDDGLT